MTDGLTPAETAHAQSILDPNPVLIPIPPKQVPTVLIASVIRKPPQVLSAFLACLDKQVFRSPVQVSYSFLVDCAASDPFADETRAVLKQFAEAHPGTTVADAPATPTGDFADGAGTHQWTPQAWHRVGALKNRLIQQCLDGRFGHLWLVDADVNCESTTLQSLLDCDVPIVAGVYWTQWTRPGPGATQVQHAGPQVWLRHPYHLDGHGYTEAEFRALLIARKLVRVWGLGACTLFRADCLAKGVNFAPVPEGLAPGPMADGEDRHLCERARRLHIPLFADAWPDIWHAYHADEQNQLPGWVEKLTAPRKSSPQPGDLVSVKLELLEPVPHPNNPQVLQHLVPMLYRARVGRMLALPELAEAVADMQVGERRIVTLHYPVHYPYASLRGASRLVGVTLLDCKPFHHPPVIERELFAGKTGSYIDATTLNDQQMADVLTEAQAVAQ